MINQQIIMLANLICESEIGSIQCPEKVGSKNKMILIMDKFKELSFEEMQVVEGGGPVRRWFCQKTREFVEWWNSSDEPVFNSCAEYGCVLV
jgi:bacteriocin-like protein